MQYFIVKHPVYFAVEIDDPVEGAKGGVDMEDSMEVGPETSGDEIQIGSITLQVVSGDIIQEKTDAIVNGTNRDLDFSMGMYLPGGWEVFCAYPRIFSKTIWLLCCHMLACVVNNTNETM